MNAEMAPQSLTHETLRRILLENEAALVIETSYPVGGSVPMHAHRSPHVVFVLDGGTLETTAADGTVSRLELRTGQAIWRAPQAHSTRNVGTTPVRILEVEVRNAAGAGEAKPLVANPSDLRWVPDALDPGRATALIVGDPTKPGPFTVRYRVPGGYALGLHVHAEEPERMTVLSGTLHWTSGAEGSGSPVHTVTAGGYAEIPAGTPHRLWADGETIVQLSGIGPRGYRYLDRTEDPAKR